jgi:hypothetical protein
MINLLNPSLKSGLRSAFHFLAYEEGEGFRKKFGDGESHMASLLREEGMMGTFDRNDRMTGMNSY